LVADYGSASNFQSLDLNLIKDLAD